MWLVSHDAHVC